MLFLSPFRLRVPKLFVREFLANCGARIDVIDKNKIKNDSKTKTNVIADNWI